MGHEVRGRGVDYEPLVLVHGNHDHYFGRIGGLDPILVTGPFKYDS